MTRSSQSPVESESQMSGVLKALNTMTSLMKQQMVRGEKSTNVGTSDQNNSEIMGIEKFKKMNPPSFIGDPSPMIAEKWLMQIQKIFDVMNCTETQKVSYASFMLEGEAEH